MADTITTRPFVGDRSLDQAIRGTIKRPPLLDVLPPSLPKENELIPDLPYIEDNKGSRLFVHG